MVQHKRVYMRACLCVRVTACLRACLRACVCSAREFVCVAAAVWLWGPLVSDGILIITTTTMPEDNLDYTTTTTATPHATLFWNR